MKVNETMFPGLRPYSIDEKSTFLGRKKELDTVVNLLSIYKSVVIYGRSGTGKSSFINACVAPRFIEKGFILINIRINLFSDINPAEQLNEIIRCNLYEINNNKDFSKEDYMDTTKSIFDYIGEEKIILVFDQFEETFIFRDKELQSKFIGQIKNLAKQAQENRIENVKLIFSIREDFLPELEELSEIIPELLSQKLRLKPYTNEDIKGYLISQDFLDEESIDVLLNTLSTDAVFSINEQKTIDLPLLQLILTDLEKQGLLISKEVARNYIITNSDVIKNSLVDRFLNSIGKSFDNLSLITIAEELISKSGDKIPLKFEDLENMISRETINRLINSRILVSYYSDEKTIVVISHDILIAPLRRLGEEAKKALNLHEHEKKSVPFKEKLENKRGLYKYDVAISFAGEDRKITKDIVMELTKKGVILFFDEFQRSNLFGKNLYDTLSKVYNEESKYCIMMVSSHYVEKEWTSHERQSAQARALKQKTEYILPIRIDQTPVPGLETISYLDLSNTSITDVVEIITAKLIED